MLCTGLSTAIVDKRKKPFCVNAIAINALADSARGGYSYANFFRTIPEKNPRVIHH
jgi:hypothetical protein